MTPLRVVKSSRFLDDLSSSALWIAQRSPEAALRFVDAVEARIALLARFPLLGGACPFLSASARGVRVTLASPRSEYLLYYRVSGDELQVLRVVHGRRDQSSLI